MRQIAALFMTFARDERGATAIEYCLIVALITVAALTALTQMGSSLGSMNGRVVEALR